MSLKKDWILKVNDEPTKLALELYYKYYSSKGLDALKYRSDIMLAYVLSDYKFRLEEYPFKESFCGCLAIDDLETTIAYNSRHSPQRKKFTIAHEIGHFFLHKHLQSHFYDRADDMLSSSGKVLEQQANSFAAQLLVPQNVMDLMLSYRFNFFRIAKITKSSNSCVRWRLIGHLMDHYDLSKEDSALLVDDYRELSIHKVQHEAAIFKILFSSGYVFKVIDGSLVEFSPTTNKPIATYPIYKVLVDIFNNEIGNED